MPLSNRVLAILAVLGAAACAASNESLLEKGEAVKVGRRNYDDYFAEVARVRDKVEGFDSDLFPVREPLVEALDVSVDTSLSELMVATRKRVGKFKDYGVTLNLRLAPNPILIVQTGELAADERDEGLLKAVQEAASRGLSTYREYAQLLALIADLDGQRQQLADGLDKLPPDFADKGLVEDEIVGAGQVLHSAERKLLRDSRSLSHFMIALSEAVDTGAAEVKDAKCDEAMASYKPPSKPKSSGPPAGKRPAGPGRPPAPRPPQPRPTPKPGGGDFDM
jgi:hypothetical protein